MNYQLQCCTIAVPVTKFMLFGLFPIAGDIGQLRSLSSSTSWMSPQHLSADGEMLVSKQNEVNNPELLYNLPQ